MPKTILKATYLRSILIFALVIMCFVMTSELQHWDVYAGAKETGIMNGDSVKGSFFEGYKEYTRVISTLLVVIALIIATAYVLKKKYGVRANIRGNRRLIQVVDHAPMGMKKSVSLVKVPGKHLLLGLTNDRIELITEIANGDIAGGSEPANKKEFMDLVKKSISERKQR
ncbi:MAG: flagellar biosynthetic protein FliO [Candidatus Scalindua sp.]